MVSSHLESDGGALNSYQNRFPARDYFRASKFCKSISWNVADLNHLGLLGLTPCFEDICLLTPIHIVFVLLSIHRIRQIVSKPYTHVEGFKTKQYLKILFTLTMALVYAGECPSFNSHEISYLSWYIKPKYFWLKNRLLTSTHRELLDLSLGFCLRLRCTWSSPTMKD